MYYRLLWCYNFLTHFDSQFVFVSLPFIHKYLGKIGDKGNREFNLNIILTYDLTYIHCNVWIMEEIVGLH